MTTTPTLWGKQLTVSASATASGASIAALDEGGFAIVWQDSGDLFGQTFDFLGDAKGGNFLSSLSGVASALSWPQAVQLGSGRLAVSYVAEASPADHDIYSAVRFGSAFSSGADFNPVDTSLQDDVVVLEAERTQDENFAVLWVRSAPGGNESLIFQRMDSQGAALGSQVLVDPTSTESQIDGDLTVLANGNIVVSWDTFNFTSLTHTLLMRVFSAQGTPISGEIPFAPTPNAAFPEVEALSNGNFVAAWQDVTDGGIYHRVFDENGDTVSIRHFYNAGFSILPEVAALQDGGYLLGWSDFNGTEGDGSSDGSLTFQRFDATGGTVGGPLVIDNPGDQSLLDLQTLSDGRVLATFSNETGDSTDETTLAYQIIDPRDAVMQGTNGADNIAGRSDDNAISGLEGEDYIVGLGGDDLLRGNAGADHLVGNVGDDGLYGGSGNDLLKGGDGDDLLLGGSGDDKALGSDGNDQLFGQGGDDLLVGGLGRDLLAGGSGQDTFDYNSVDESGKKAALQDVIADFVHGEDRIDLRTIDAMQGTAGNQSFTFIGAAAFSAEGQVRFVQTASQTIVQGNVSGTGGPELVITLDGLVGLSASDFVL
jgi:Ca2+-binding RTX toxin-like protein